MAKSIDPTRLKRLRQWKGLSQQQVARRAKLTKGSLYRLESGKQPGIRERTREGLAKALGVEPGVLTGELPLPEPETGGVPKPEPPGSPMTFRVDDAVHNAFWLASRSYGLSMTRIVELAPFLFVCAAEASLERRRAKLRELRKLLHGDGAVLFDFPHLPFNIAPDFYARDAIEAEKRSIAAHKILADDLPVEIFPEYRHEEDEGAEDRHFDSCFDNPFMRFLLGFQPADKDLASISAFDDSSVLSVVRRDVALELCCGDSDLADEVVWGHVPLYKMPSALLESDAAEDRIAWLRERCAEYKVRTPDPLAELVIE